jgi:hypothetical protein
LAHLRPDQLDQVLQRLHSGADVDLSSTLISAELLERILHAVRDDDGRPVFGRLSFLGTHFTGDATFTGVVFTGFANFVGATFTGDADFGSAQFSEDATFGNAQFNRNAYFGSAQFIKGASFSRAQFNGSAGDDDESAGISDYSGWFTNARFTGTTSFDGAQFAGTARFDGAQFQNATSLGTAGC